MATYDYAATEWHLKQCNVKEAWEKSKGEGITIVHADTGWTEHPELIDTNRYFYSNYKESRNFLVSPPTDAANYEYWDLPDNSPEWATRKVTPTDKLARDTLDDGVLKFPSHGTSTASVMMSDAGLPNNVNTVPYPGREHVNILVSQYVTGIAPLVKVIPCRVARSVLLSFDHKWLKSTIATLTKALEHAIYLAGTDTSIGVVSISLGAVFSMDIFGRHRRLSSVLELARKKGIIVCAAAGQFAGGLDLNAIRNPSFPGRSEHTICVAGCDNKFDRPPEGFYGNEVDISSPGWGWGRKEKELIDPGSGVCVAKTLNEGSFYYYWNTYGTSHSTALVSGACALWQSYHGRDNLIKKYGRPFLHDVFKYVLQQSCQHSPSNDWDTSKQGPGVLDAKGLLEYALPTAEDAQQLTVDSGWPETRWGPQDEWGKET
jgi:serine protease